MSSARPGPATAIIIPTWNNYGYLRQTIESLRKVTTGSDYRLIVVDNASYDETPDYLRKAGIRTYRNDHNEGFVRGVNAGMRLCSESERIMLLNDDVQIVDPFWIARMNQTLDSDASIGAVGPVSNFVMAYQSILHSWSVDLPQIHEVPFLVFFAVLLRQGMPQKIGLLDERFGMGGNDDLDYSMRITDAGYRLMVNRNAFVWHYGAKSIGRIGGYEEVEPRTRKILIEKWGKERVDDLVRDRWEEMREQKEAACS